MKFSKILKIFLPLMILLCSLIFGTCISSNAAGVTGTMQDVFPMFRYYWQAYFPVNEEVSNIDYGSYIGTTFSNGLTPGLTGNYMQLYAKPEDTSQGFYTRAFFADFSPPQGHINAGDTFTVQFDFARSGAGLPFTHVIISIIGREESGRDIDRQIGEFSPSSPSFSFHFSYHELALRSFDFYVIRVYFAPASSTNQSTQLRGNFSNIYWDYTSYQTGEITGAIDDQTNQITGSIDGQTNALLNADVDSVETSDPVVGDLSEAEEGLLASVDTDGVLGLLSLTPQTSPLASSILALSEVLNRLIYSLGLSHLIFFLAPLGIFGVLVGALIGVSKRKKE